MTVATTGNKLSYAGDGVTVAFSFPRLFFADADLRVILRDAAGAETVQTIVTHYTVTGAENPAGGTVTMVTPPASGETLVIVRRTAQHQNTDYITGGAFSADGHEDALDKLTLEVQDLQEQVNRAPKLKETTTSATPDIPEPSSLGVLRWNAAADALENIFAAVLGAIGITVTADNRLMKSEGVAGDLQETGITVDDNLSADMAEFRTLWGNNDTGAYSHLRSGNTGYMIYGSSNAASLGANILAFAEGHATKANDLEFRQGTTIRAAWDASANRWDFMDLRVRGVAVLEFPAGGVIENEVDTSLLQISGGTTASVGGNILLYGGAHATQANDISLRTGTTVRAFWDDSNSRWDFFGTILHAVDTLRRGAATSFLGVSGGSTGSLGANLRMYGESHATQADDIEFRSGATIRLAWDASDSAWLFQSTAIKNIAGITLVNPRQIITNANSSVVGISGSTSVSLGGNLQLYGDGHATQANDMQLRTGSTVRLQWDESIARWRYFGHNLIELGTITPNATSTFNLGSSALQWATVFTDRLEIDANFHLELDGSSDPRLTMDSGDDFLFDRSANQYVFQIATANVLRLAATAVLPDVPLRLKSYTVSTLPTGAAGDTAYASDGRKAGEGAAAGTGIWVLHDGTNWLSDPYNNVTAVA